MQGDVPPAPSVAVAHHRVEDSFQRTQDGKKWPLRYVAPIDGRHVGQAAGTSGRDEAGLGPEYDNEYGLVVTTKSGRPLSPRNLSRDFRRLVQSLDIPYVTWHGLRHTHATLLLEENVHPKMVSDRLGHSSVMVTLDTDSHVLPGLQEAAAERVDAMLADDSAYKDQLA